LEHGWENLIAIQQCLHTVSRYHWRTEQRAHGSQELRVRHCIVVLNLARDFLVAGREIEYHEADHNSHKRGYDYCHQEFAAHFGEPWEL